MNRIYFFFIALCWVVSANAQGGMSLDLKATIPLPGVEGRLDHCALDPATERGFFAALGNGTLEIVDLGGGKRLHAITGLKEPQGVLYLAGFNLLVVANGGDGTCRFYDGTSYAERGRVSGLDDADNMRFDAKVKKIYVGYGSGALAIIDPATLKQVGNIPLPGHPESFQLEEGSPRIFVNIPQAKQIAVLDRDAGKIIATWPLTDVLANFPMALDQKQHRLFVACRRPARLLAYDTQSGQRVADADMSGDSDDLFFDPATNGLIASCGEGFIDLFHFDLPATITRTAQLPTAGGARTGLFIAKQRSFSLTVPHRGSQGAEIRIYKLPPAP